MQFDRQAYLEVGQPGASGVRVRNLRIAFEVEKSVRPTANTCKVAVYNLAEGTRTRLQEQYQRVAIFAGYAADAVLPLVFAGDADNVEHRAVPPEWVSEIRVGDGRRALCETRISRSFAPGTSASQVCRAIADDMQLPIEDEQALEDSDFSFSNGFAFVGQAEDALRRAADAAGLEWSIQNGVLRFLPRKETLQVQAVRLSPDSGLLDAPERIMKPRSKLKADAPKLQWMARCLLNARIEPGTPVQLDSRTARGVFRVDTLRHVGDTHGTDWFTELELAAYGIR